MKGKKASILFSIVTSLMLLLPSVLGDTGTFGYESAGSSQENCENTIVFGKFTMDAIDNAVAQILSAYVSHAGPAKNYRGGIYDTSGNLITNGDTNQISVSETGWILLSFAISPELTASTTYYLGVWCNDNQQDDYVHFDDSGGQGVYYYDGTFGSMPSSVTYSELDPDGICSIHCDYYYEPENSAPVQSSEQPTNESSDIALQPRCNITVTDADLDTMTVYFFTNHTGSWAQRQQNSSISSGTTCRYDYTGASSYSTTYWWAVNVTDGITWTNETYHFTTEAYVWSNTKPTASSPSPTNGSNNIALYTPLSVYIGDADGNTSNISWYTNYTGSWVIFQTNYSVLNTSISCSNFTTASSYSTTYYWLVTVNDSHDNVSYWFYFTTLAAPDGDTLTFDSDQFSIMLMLWLFALFFYFGVTRDNSIHGIYLLYAAGFLIGFPSFDVFDPVSYFVIAFGLIFVLLGLAKLKNR